MSDPTIKLLRDLIAIDSVNPSLVSGGAGEGEIAEFVAETLRSVGMEVEVTEVTHGRPNVVGVIEGRSAGKTLVLCGHTDTVSVEGMKAPFDPVEKDGRLYGRGSGDMKGGLAAMIDAARSIANSGGLSSGKLIVAAVVDEEYASIGAEALVKKWHADAAVVTEPTDLIVAIGHKGFSWIEIITEGRAAHGSRPNEGRDAILAMARVLSELELLDRKLQARPAHPVLKHGSLHASLIEGGRELSTYPDRCVLQMERRTIGNENGQVALDEVEAILNKLRTDDPEFKGSARLTFDRLPYETPPEHELPSLLESILNNMERQTSREGMTYWTDASILGGAGIPSVVFGPGGSGYHGLEEYVNVNEVVLCRDALIGLTRRFCSS